MTTPELQQRIAALPPEKRALFERMLAERATTPRVRELSITQHGLWFLDKITPGSPLYTIAWRCQLDGPLQPAPFAAAINDVVARHEALRTQFDVLDGRPVQVVVPSLEIPVPVVDLAELPEPRREPALDTRIRAETSTGFDLASAPLIRVRLYRLSPQRHVLLLLSHHIVFDYVSTDILLDETMGRYGDRVAGRLDPLPPLAVQYGDFADWQREFLSGQRLDRLVAYWRDQLAGSTGTLHLPADRPRPPVQSFRGAAHRFRIPPDVIEALRAVASRERVTLFMVYLAAFGVLLHRYSGDPVVNVGLAVDTRRRAELRSLIGFFINAVVARTDLTGDPSFHELLDRVRRACIDAYEHQDLPFDQVVEAVAPARSLSHNPLFQVTCALDEQPSLGRTAAGLTVSAVDGLHSGYAKFDLSFGGVVGPDGAVVMVDYNLDLFDESTVAGLGRQFVTLLTAIGRNPRLPISQLTLLDAADQRLVTGAWAAGDRAAGDRAAGDRAAIDRGAIDRGAIDRVGRPAAVPFVDAVVEWAAKTPDPVAVVAETTSLTYGQLLDRAATVATRLRALGAGPQAVVGLRLPRGADAVVAVLGVHLAGAACMPLDPAVPVPAVAGLAGLLTTRELAPAGGTGAALVLVDQDEGRPGPATGAPDWAASRVELPSADCPAYLPSTAGATGPPKRVALTYRALAAAIASECSHLAVEPGDRVAQLADLWTVEAVREIYLALSAGATLSVLAGEPSGAELAAALRERGVTVARLAPALARQLTDTAGTGLRVAVTGGEAFAGAPARRWYGSAPRTLVGYGAAETCGTVSWSGLAPDGSGEVPAGEPVAEVRRYVLDPWLRPQPPGVPGELYVGGPYLAIGYPGQPGLTARWFVPDPFATEPGGRLFRTGDLARWRGDGRLSLLGRAVDRPRAGEPWVPRLRVEAALTAHPDVADAVVVTYRPRRAASLLTGYLVPATDATAPSQRDLQALLTDRLPEYLIPSAILALDRLPVGPGGRVDRTALPPPAQVAAAATARIAPRSATERVLAGVWSDLLGVAEVGSEDSFFDLGGHSLLAVQLLTQVGELFGVELQMRQLFHATTPAGLAAEIARLLGGPERAEQVAGSVELVLALTEEEVQQRLTAIDGLAQGSDP